MLGLVLLYVGAVLVLNGIWLLGHIGDREIGVMNIFTGGVGFIAAIIAATLGVLRGELTFVALGAFVLLFAFTYLWVAINRYLNPDGRGLGWYCLFVAITAAPTAIITLVDSGGDTWLVWLGLNWAAWAVLWFVYFLLLAVGLNITRFSGYLTFVIGVLTAWLPGYLLITGFLQAPVI
ncbi:AmiS/UreI family transporter [Allosalinactinospora lopnorensis]|uniref:AmiS/UreI family transporter n=1 Tax=Allosalinactinospora lopnorensis TaxID=1352348 RepID=UPI000623EF71|nr:AmiS/UreI family transporter [Allosalinactinospora lopnorensis]